MVAYLDELEGKGLVERRPYKNDRRNNALYLTKAGQAACHSTARLAEEHQQALLAGLSKPQQVQLAALLERIADHQGILPNAVLPKRSAKEPARQASSA